MQYPYPFNFATKDDIKLILDVMNKSFESLIRETNARFEAINKRLNLITWVTGIGFTLIGGALIGLIIHLITKG